MWESLLKIMPSKSRKFGCLAQGVTQTAKLRVASAISELGIVGKTSQEVERAAEGQSKKA